MRAQDLREDGGGFEEKAGRRRSWWRTPQRRKMESDFTCWGLLREYPSSALLLRRGKWRLTACLAPHGACDWLQVVARGTHVQGRRLYCPSKSFSTVSTNSFWGSSCNRVRLSEGSRVFGLRDPGSSIGPFPILRLGFSYCRDLFIETPWF